MPGASIADRYNEMQESINLAIEARTGAILLSPHNGERARLALISSALNVAGIEAIVISPETMEVVRDEQIDLSMQMEDGKILLAITPEDRRTQYMKPDDAVIALMDNNLSSAHAYSVCSVMPVPNQRASILSMLNEGIKEMMNTDNAEFSIIPIDAYDPREPDKAVASHPSLPMDADWRIRCEHLNLSKGGSETIEKSLATNALKDRMTKADSALSYTLSLGCLDVATMTNGHLKVIEYGIAKSHDARVERSTDCDM